MKRILLTLFLVLFCTSQAFAIVGKEDIHHWDGLGGTSSYTRSTSGGYTVTLHDVNYYVDVLAAYGGHVNYTRGTINDAITAIGSSDNVGLLLNPGTWVIDANLTITSNYLTILPSGVTIKPNTGISVYIQGPISAGNYPVFDTSASGSTVALSGPAIEGIVYDQWYGGNSDNIGIGMKPRSGKKLDVTGTISGTSLEGGLATTDLVGRIADTQLPTIITDVDNTGKIFHVDLTSNETLSGKTIFGSYISGATLASRSYTAGVTATVISPSGGESFRIYTKEDTLVSGNTVYLHFMANDTIYYHEDFVAGTSKFEISGTTTEVIIDVWSSGLSIWVISATSGVPTIDWD